MRLFCQLLLSGHIADLRSVGMWLDIHYNTCTLKQHIDLLQHCGSDSFASGIVFRELAVSFVPRLALAMLLGLPPSQVEEALPSQSQVRQLSFCNVKST